MTLVDDIEGALNVRRDMDEPLPDVIEMPLGSEKVLVRDAGIPFGTLETLFSIPVRIVDDIPWMRFLLVWERELSEEDALEGIRVNVWNAAMRELGPPLLLEGAHD